jgi:lysophospholipase L1-like esterase
VGALKWTALFVGCVISAVSAEIFARAALGYKPLAYSRPYDPIFVSGDFVGELSRGELGAGSNSPAANDYEPTLFGNYVWRGRTAPRSSTALSDFLFAHYLSRYSSREVDDIMCQKPDALAVFVLGGSVAVGSSASSKAASWHALLEQMLRDALHRSDVYVFNAAMGGFNSTQERLAYHLAVSARGGRFVLILNGANDLLGPASSRTRPGDPFQIGTRYRQFYGNPLILWFAEHSAVFNYFLQYDLTKAVVEYRNELARDDELFERYANAVVNMYIENMAAVLSDCDAKTIACLVAVQPVRALAENELGRSSPERKILPPYRVRRLYDVLRKGIADSRYSRHFIDLSRLIGTQEEINYYTDTVHLDDRGQKLLAQALLPRVIGAIERFQQVRANEAIFSCQQVLPKETATIDLSRLIAVNRAELVPSDGGVRLIADSRQWAYSATMTVGRSEDISRPNTTIRVEFGAVKGVVGIGTVANISASSFLFSRAVFDDLSRDNVEIPVESGTKQLVLIFRNDAVDGLASEIEIKKISILSR